MIIRQWRHAGMTCVVRHIDGNLPHWCGYVFVLPGSPFYGKNYEAAVFDDVCVHGGLTFSGFANSRWNDFDGLEWSCRELGEPFAVGFDMCHCYDLDWSTEPATNLRTLEECVAETNRLAEQLAAIANDKKEN